MADELTYKYVKDFINSTGYTLLSDSYKDAKNKLEIMCPEGHINNQNWNNFKSGYRCNKCGTIKSSDKTKLSYGHVKEFIVKEGYTLLSDSYKNARSQLLVRCPEGHEYGVMFGNFRVGKRCKSCADNKLRLEYKHVRDFINSTDYTLLSKSYNNNKGKLLIRCDEEHEYKASFNSFQLGKRCPFCSEKTSNAEKDVALFVESLGIPIIRNDRTQVVNPLTGYNLELDIWISFMNKAIEYNGTYWHSLPTKIQYDTIKRNQCKQLGIDLLIVNEENWMNNKEMEMIKIRNFING